MEHNRDTPVGIVHSYSAIIDSNEVIRLESAEINRFYNVSAGMIFDWSLSGGFNLEFVNFTR